MTLEIAFFDIVRLTRAKSSPGGKMPDSSARPIVVSTSFASRRVSPSSSVTSIGTRILTFACNSATPFS